MSLIEQALRRVQDPVINTTTQTPPKTDPAEPTAHSWKTESPPASLTTSPAPRVTNALVAVALAIIGLTVVLVVGGAFWMGHTITSPQSTAGGSAATAPSALEKTAPAVPTPAHARSAAHGEPEFVLSGVVEGVGNPYAVINGAIASIGDQVGKATLVAISGSTATLRLANGEQMVLRVAQ